MCFIHFTDITAHNIPTLLALSQIGKIGVWHAMTQHWQIQDLVPILSFDTAGSFLLLGCNNGSIYYIGNFI